MNSREADWASLMLAGRSGDAAAYERCLRDMAQTLRPMVRRGLLRAGASAAETEDVVQDILIAVHLKQHTWDASRPIGPWISAIARHKLVDALRRRGGRTEIPIEDFAEILAAEDDTPTHFASDVQRSLEQLPERQRAVINAIAVEGGSIAQTAGRLQITEGAVRVALHRGLAALAKRAGRPT